ncbi:hypothetical protein BT63DRAFT_70535 [Microthyrium microscopicum]|uniref:DASH complex subunit DAD2 n=1 Tax=Microthyrium microscopicum TaxID=703497 RepID=A0A6A6U3W0_9PEZI|nr:hypothetical protein BT63DRAFT_70535 [Microthyrium microscopicum]
MSNFTRPIPSHTRNLSLNQPSASQQAALVARVNEKKAELAGLRELQALSGSVADQMQMLEDKLSTLADGTEAVATVLANWHSVLRAIHMASSEMLTMQWRSHADERIAKLPKPKDDSANETVLPQTLVRIPTQHADLIPQGTSGSIAE